MGWVEAVGEAVQYVEDHITEELSAEEIAKQVNISPFYFQKGFAMLCRVYSWGIYQEPPSGSGWQ